MAQIRFTKVRTRCILKNYGANIYYGEDYLK